MALKIERKKEARCSLRVLQAVEAARKSAARNKAEGAAMQGFRELLESGDLHWQREMPAIPKPSRCNAFARQQLAESLPLLCRYLVAKTLDGDLNSLKLLWQMAELDEKTPAKAKRARATSLAFARKTLAEYKAARQT